MPISSGIVFRLVVMVLPLLVSFVLSSCGDNKRMVETVDKVNPNTKSWETYEAYVDANGLPREVKIGAPAVQWIRSGDERVSISRWPWPVLNT